MKRFWDTAAVQPVERGYGIALDGRPLRLPGGTVLHLDSLPLAEAVAHEWATAGERKGAEMTMEQVPLTRLVGTAVDRIAKDPAPSAEAIAQYGEADLLCYRAQDRRLAALQEEQWQPLLDWAARHHGAPLRVTTGVTHVAQPDASLRALHAAVGAHNPYGLSALGIVVPALGSLVLGLALSAGRLDAVEAYRLAALDETYQESFWGVDAEATTRRAHVAEDVALAARLLELSR